MVADSSDKDSTMKAFLLKDETMESFKESITVQTVNISATPHQFMETMQKALKNKCPDAKFNVNFEDENSVGFDYLVESCPKAPDQYNLNVFKKDGSILKITNYAIKDRSISAETMQKWFDILKSPVFNQFLNAMEKR